MGATYSVGSNYKELTSITARKGIEKGKKNYIKPNEQPNPETPIQRKCPSYSYFIIPTFFQHHS
jgi:hypothetical protein